MKNFAATQLLIGILFITWATSLKAQNVGIGTVNPVTQLDVRGEISWGNNGAKLATDQGASIELRGTGVPFIDFSNDGTIDYDARLILNNDDRLTLEGAEFNVLNTISAVRIKITATGYPDYVFLEGYDLKSLEEVKEHIEKNGHLPGVPAEAEIVEQGLDLNDQSMWQMEKIEELFLHNIALNEQLKELNKQMNALNEENKLLESRIEEIENQ